MYIYTHTHIHTPTHTPIEIAMSQIHFDGHSDMAPPAYDRRMPFFHFPNTKEEMMSLMQANDRFIQVGRLNDTLSRRV